MISTEKHNQKIIDFLAQLGISATANFGVIGVSRDDMCAVANVRNKIPEEKGGDYEIVLDAIKAQFPHLKLFWSGKTDDDLFLDVMIPS
jgi:selenophosphate synthase